MNLYLRKKERKKSFLYTWEKIKSYLKWKKKKKRKKKKWSYYSKLKKGDVTIFPNYMKSKKNSHRFFPI